MSRCVLKNLHTGERFECQFNPESLKESFEMNWTENGRFLQYSGTKRSLPSVSFFLSREKDTKSFEEFRHFLRSFTARPEGEYAPPRCQFIWPGVLTFDSVISGIELDYRAIDASGIKRYTATVTFKDPGLKRFSSEDRRAGQ